MAATRKSTTTVPKQPLPPDEQVLEHADNLKLGDALNLITSARTGVEQTFSQLMNELMDKTRTYEEVCRAIELKKNELQAIFGKEDLLKNLDELKTTIDEQRLAWDAEKKTIARQRIEEKAQYEHQRDQERREDRDQYEADLRADLRRKEQAEYERRLEWERKDATLKAAQQELDQLRQQVTLQPQLVTATVDKQVLIIKAQMSKDKDHEIQVLKLENKAAVDRLNDRIAVMENQLAGAQETIESLREQVTDAQERSAKTVQDALAASSGQKALDEVRRTLESQQTGGGRK